MQPKALKIAIEYYMTAHDNFSIWEITRALRGSNEAFCLEDNSLCGLGNIDHSLVKSIFLALLEEKNFDFDVSIEYSNGNPYRVYSHRSKISNQTSLFSDVLPAQKIIEYLQRRQTPTTIKQVQSRFKREKIKCQDIYNILYSCSEVILTPSDSVSKYIIQI